VTLRNFAAPDEIGQQREGEIPETNSFGEIESYKRLVSVREWKLLPLIPVEE